MDDVDEVIEEAKLKVIVRGALSITAPHPNTPPRPPADDPGSQPAIHASVKALREGPVQAVICMWIALAMLPGPNHTYVLPIERGLMEAFQNFPDSRDAPQPPGTL